MPKPMTRGDHIQAPDLRTLILNELSERFAADRASALAARISEAMTADPRIRVLAVDRVGVVGALLTASSIMRIQVKARVGLAGGRLEDASPRTFELNIGPKGMVSGWKVRP